MPDIPLPTPYLHPAALEVMGAGWEKHGGVYTAQQMREYAAAHVAAYKEILQKFDHDAP